MIIVSQSSMKDKSQSQLILERMTELERLDESVKVKHLPRRLWPEELIKNKLLFWQVPRSTGKFLTLLVRKLRPKNILELGTSAGYSGLCMLRGFEGSHLFTIEFSKYRFDIAKETFSKTLFADRVTMFNSKIEPVLLKWNLNIGSPVDFVLIDADKPAYLSNFKLIEPHLSKGAMVVVDNILDSIEKTKPLVSYVLNNDDFLAEVLELDNGLLIAVKK